MNKKYVPNLNTLSTLIDRISVECVKKAHFMNALDNNEVTDEMKSSYQEKVRMQDEIISLIREEMVAMLVNIFEDKKYEYYGENRTFN
jgi:hypothetical protein